MASYPPTLALRAAVKAEVVPLLTELGFKRHGKSFAARPIDGSFGGCYWRGRDPYIDEIHIRWDYHGHPHFVLEFWSDQTERMLEPNLIPRDRVVEHYYVTVDANPQRPRRWYDFFLGGRSFQWFGENMSRREAIDSAKARIQEIDRHLKVRAPSPYMRLAPDVVVKRFDPSNARPVPPPPLDWPG